ncbi:MAG: YtxH domain-containing protein [Bacilli bacterium]
MSEKKSGVGKFLVGAAIGVGAGLLFAPDKGTITRRKLANKLDEAIKSLEGIDKDEVKRDIIKRVDEIRLELSDMDSEKILKAAKEKARIIEKKAEELYKEAVKRGTPVLESIAQEIRTEAINATREVLNKLEESEKTSKPVSKIKKAKTSKA